MKNEAKTTVRNTIADAREELRKSLPTILRLASDDEFVTFLSKEGYQFDMTAIIEAIKQVSGWASIEPLLIKLDSVKFPVVRYLGVEFFFIGKYVFGRTVGETDVYDFRYAETVNAIVVKTEGLEVLLTNGEKYLIAGSPTLGGLYTFKR